jgi:hypothetical protein
MANQKITQLPSASIATGSNVLPIVQSGSTEQITVTNLGTGILNLGLAVTASTVSSTNNGNGTNFKVGDDTWIGDVNLSNHLQIKGQQDGTKGFVKFGSGSGSPIIGGVAESDLLQVTGSVNVTGSITANGFTGPLTGTASNALVAVSSSYALEISSSIRSGDYNYNVLFQGNESNEVYTNSALRFNPLSNILIATSSLAITASFASDAGLLDGKDSSQFANKVTGSWTLTPGANTVNFTVSQNGSYTMWVNGNIPNGIVTWNATVTATNSNVPVIGSQYGWYYVAGNELVLTSIPSQIIGENGVISTTMPSVTNSNVFTFGITNNSEENQTVSWGYITL